MTNLFFALGCGLGAVGVLLGAFGSHGLRNRASLELMATFETGVRYQLVHALAMLAAAVAVSWYGSWPPAAAGWLFLVGTILFSGSLYLLVLSGKRWLGAVTPVGGLALVAGWITLGLSVLVS